MAVVVDEFEVMPAAEREPGGRDRPEQTSSEPSPAAVRAEVERTLSMRAERAARLAAD